MDLVVKDAACAAGLPGMERIDVRDHVRRVDALTASCRQFTDRAMPRFHAGRCDYPESEPKFRIQVMITHRRVARVNAHQGLGYSESASRKVPSVPKLG